MKIAVVSRDSVQQVMEGRLAASAREPRKYVYVLPSGRRLSVVMDEEREPAGADELADSTVRA